MVVISVLILKAFGLLYYWFKCLMSSYIRKWGVWGVGTYLDLGWANYGISKNFNLYQHLQGGGVEGGVLGWNLEEKGARPLPEPMDLFLVRMCCRGEL